MLGVSAATKDLFDEKVQLKIVVTIEKVGEVTGTTATHNKEKPRRQSLYRLFSRFFDVFGTLVATRRSF